MWEPENPHLYEIRTSLWKNGEMIDARVDITGFREAGFRKDGFYLNGKKLRLRGLNRHQFDNAIDRHLTGMIKDGQC